MHLTKTLLTVALATWVAGAARAQTSAASGQTRTIAAPCPPGQIMLDVYSGEYKSGPDVVGSIPCGMSVTLIKREPAGDLKVKLPNGIVGYILTPKQGNTVRQYHAETGPVGTLASDSNSFRRWDARMVADKANLKKEKANLAKYALPEKTYELGCGSSGKTWTYPLWKDFLAKTDYLQRGGKDVRIACNEQVFLIRKTVTGREIMTSKGDIGFQVYDALLPVAEPSRVTKIQSLGYTWGETTHVHHGLILPAESDTSCSVIVDELDCETEHTPPVSYTHVKRTDYVTNEMARGGGYIFNFICNGDRRFNHCETLTNGDFFSAHIQGNQLYVQVCPKHKQTCAVASRMLQFTITHTDRIDMSKISYSKN